MEINNEFDMFQVLSEKAKRKEIDHEVKAEFEQGIDMLKEVVTEVPKQVSLESEGFPLLDNETGEYVAYHIESKKDSIKYRSESTLTIDLLKDDVPLFLCGNLKDWYPSHFSTEDKKDIVIYQVRFKVKSYVIFKSKENENHFNSAYFDLFSIKIDDTSGHAYCSPSNRLKKLRNISPIDLFWLIPEEELSEGFLINAKQHVTSITKLDLLW